MQANTRAKTIFISLAELGIPESATKDKYVQMISFTEMLQEIKGFTEDIVNDYVIRNLVIRDGDVISFCKKAYRNSAKCIWYDGCVHDLDDTADEYGALPKTETLIVKPGTPYHPRYWNDAIDHNGIYYVCDDYINECVENICKIKDEFYEKLLIAHFTHNGCKETVILNPESIANYETMRLKNIKKIFVECLKTKPFDMDNIGFTMEGYDTNFISMVTPSYVEE